MPSIPQVPALAPAAANGRAYTTDPAAPILARVFARLDPIALGVAVGLVAGLGLLAATLVLVVKGGPVVGPNLWLLMHYFPRYSVTWTGAFVGLLYGCMAGFAAGWSFAVARNGAARLLLRYARARGEREAERRFLDDL